MKMSAPLLSAGVLAILMTSSALAQGLLAPDGRRGVIIQNQPNTTGNSRDLVISYGATGADTVTTNSAAGAMRAGRSKPFPTAAPTVDRAAADGPGGYRPRSGTALAEFTVADGCLPREPVPGLLRRPLSEPERPGMMRHAANVLPPLVARRTRR